jgi:hypothetical protein
MSGAIRPLPNTPSWCGIQLKKAQGQFYLYLLTFILETCTKIPIQNKQKESRYCLKIPQSVTGDLNAMRSIVGCNAVQNKTLLTFVFITLPQGSKLL